MRARLACSRHVLGLVRGGSWMASFVPRELTTVPPHQGQDECHTEREATGETDRDHALDKRATVVRGNRRVVQDLKGRRVSSLVDSGGLVTLREQEEQRLLHLLLANELFELEAELRNRHGGGEEVRRTFARG